MKIMRSIEIGRPTTASGAKLATPLLPQGAASTGAADRADSPGHPAATTSDFQTTTEPGLPGTHQGDMGVHVLQEIHARKVTCACMVQVACA